MRMVDGATAKAPHPWIFLALVTPFGVSTGYVTVTLAFILGAKGVSVAAIGALAAASIFPQAWKVLWAPLVDTTLTPRLWYLLGALGVGLTILTMSVIPNPASALPLLSVLAAVSSVASSLCGMTADSMLAHFDVRQQGRASGWAQAGNFAGTGVGGGIGLYLAQHVQAQWVSGAGLGVLCMACAAVLPLAPHVPRLVRPSIAATFVEVLREVWAVLKSRPGLLVIFLMLLPIGSGGLQALWNSAAGEWKVSADTVALTGGLITGVASGVAALFGGYVCDWLDRRTTYCLFGVLIAIEVVIVAHLPRTPEVWIGASVLYNALLGACYAAYSAVVLEVIGRGAAATKFNLMASVANVPVTFMPVVDGVLHDRHGTNAMFYGEAALSVAAAVLFGVVVLASGRLIRKAPV
jgi:MFS transporter, PAT family, beta-lactamase induction signal transducer AmpG